MCVTLEGEGSVVCVCDLGGRGEMMCMYVCVVCAQLYPEARNGDETVLYMKDFISACHFAKCRYLLSIIVTRQ